MGLGPQLQRLSLFPGASYQQCDGLDDLVPAILTHCPLLAHLAVGHLGPGNTTAVSAMRVLHDCWTETRICKQISADTHLADLEAIADAGVRA